MPSFYNWVRIMKKLYFGILLIFVLFIVGCSNLSGIDPHLDPHSFPGGNLPPHIINSEDLSIHFLELDNKYTGDCVYINYGDIDIIIDAGSRQDSAAAICEYINQYMRDGKLEYVIATHAHQDHIAGFYTARGITGVMDAYDIGTIIDFPKTNSSSATFFNYTRTRDAAVDRGAVHYTALECYNEENGAQRIYDLGGGVALEILYNYFYESNADNENNYSVCVRIIQGDRQYIFTGDLEAEGEEKLVEFYDTGFNGLGHCVLYKGGHHGSSTSSNDVLLEAITPEYVCICTCAGSSEYSSTILNQFPTQAFIERIAPYTDKVYVTTQMVNYPAGVYTPLNGNIVFLVSQGRITVSGSNDDRKLKDSEWFRMYREMPDAWR